MRYAITYSLQLVPLEKVSFYCAHIHTKIANWVIDQGNARREKQNRVIEIFLPFEIRQSEKRKTSNRSLFTTKLYLSKVLQVNCNWTIAVDIE